MSTSSKLDDEFNVLLPERCGVSETCSAWDDGYAFCENLT